MRFKRYFYLSCPYIIFFMAGVIFSSLHAQDHRPTSPSGVLLTSPAIFCSPKDFLFKIDTSYYPHGSVIYVCDRQDSITVVFKDTKHIIFGDTSRITSYPVIHGATDTSTTDQYFSVWPQNFNAKGEAEVEVEITEKPSNNKSTIKLKIEKAGPKIKIDKSGSYGVGAYAFDDHQYNYSSQSTIPSKLIIANKSDNVKLDIKSGDANKILAKNKFHDYLTPDSLGYSSGGNILTISHNLPQLSMNDVPVQICANTILDADVRPERQVSLAYFTLCHKSDDTANYCIDKNGNGIPYEPADSMHIYGGYLPDCVTPISDSMHRCINVGPDKILTNHQSTALGDFWVQRLNNSARPMDVFLKPKTKNAAILPSRDTTQAIKYFCNSRPPDTLKKCPTISLNLINELNALNTIYAKAGVQFNVVNYGDLSVDWDLYRNGRNDYVYNPALNNDYPDNINMFLNNFRNNNPTVKGFILGGNVQNGTNTVAGFASPGSFVTYLNLGLLNSRTLSHELGHSMFSFGHPDDNSSALDNLTLPVNNDPYNLMNSGHFYTGTTTPPIANWRIRKYQWRKIHRTPGIF